MFDTNLRTLVTTIDGEVAHLSSYPAGAIPPSSILELQASWARLVGLLALGPEPQVRPCPTCNRMVMSAATRCGHCWNKLRPPATNGA